jgi:hypothetical protein
MRRTNPKKKETARFREVARRDPGLEEVLDFVESLGPIADEGGPRDTNGRRILLPYVDDPGLVEPPWK